MLQEFDSWNDVEELSFLEYNTIHLDNRRTQLQQNEWHEIVLKYTLRQRQTDKLTETNTGNKYQEDKTCWNKTTVRWER